MKIAIGVPTSMGITAHSTQLSQSMVIPKAKRSENDIANVATTAGPMTSKVLVNMRFFTSFISGHASRRRLNSVYWNG